MIHLELSDKGLLQILNIWERGKGNFKSDLIV